VQDLYTIDVVGAWLGIFLTFCILSFLYKDNPFYKLAEHLFVGVSIGYLVTQQYYNVLRPKLVVALADGHWLALIPLALVLAMLVKAVSRRFSWVGRYPLAFVVALFAGLQINAAAQAELGAQIQRAMGDLDEKKVDVNQAGPAELGRLPGVIPSTAAKIVAYRAQNPIDSIDELEQIPDLTDVERALVAEGRGDIKGLDAQADAGQGGRYWFGILSNLLLLAGTLASLLYFYFSLAHKGLVGKVSRFGVWVLMIGFGASFGYTVQGRIALAIGRAQDVMGTRMTASDAAQVQGPWVALVSVAIIVAGIAFWEIRTRRKHGGDTAGGSQ
jgi:hypothetical protein